MPDVPDVRILQCGQLPHHRMGIKVISTTIMPWESIKIVMKIDNSLIPASNVQQHGLWGLWPNPQLLRPDGHSDESGGEDAKED